MILTRKWFRVTGAIHLQRLHEPAVHMQRKNIEKNAEKREVTIN